MTNLAGPMSGAERAKAFYDHLEAEVLDNGSQLRPGRYACLSRYYRSLKQNTALRAFYRYNWTRRVAPMLDVLMAMPRHDSPVHSPPWRILDAGCGVGTESIFWSTVREDVQVIGVDIDGERLDAARARRTAYERRLGRALNLRFQERDVFRVLQDIRFDLVWAMESLSHIDPAQAFLDLACAGLSSTGILVISDSHILNPAMAWRVYRLRTSGVAARSRRTLSSGENLSYAQECLFSVGRLSRMLKRAGFRSVRSQLIVFFPPALARYSSILKICTQVDSFLNVLPLVRNLGGIYKIVAAR